MMKRKSYVKPTLILIIGLSTALVLFFIGSFVSANELPNGFLLRTEGNFIEAESGDELILYFYENYELNYEYEVESNSDVMIHVSASGDEYAVYHLEITSIPTNEEFTTELSEEFYATTLVINLNGDASLKFDVYEDYLLEGLEEQYIDGLAPDMYINNYSTGFMSNTILLISVLLGLVVGITALVWYLIVYSHNSKLAPKQPAYTIPPQPVQRQHTYTSEIERLIETDKQFSLDCQSGKEEAWMSYMHPNVIMGTSGDLPFITNGEEIKNVIGEIFKMENMSFRWKPVYAFVSNDGSLGVTVGLYKRNYMKDGEEVLDKGKYMTVWRKVNGQWKAVFDMGN